MLWSQRVSLSDSAPAQDALRIERDAPGPLTIRVQGSTSSALDVIELTILEVTGFAQFTRTLLLPLGPTLTLTVFAASLVASAELVNVNEFGAYGAPSSGATGTVSIMAVDLALGGDIASSLACAWLLSPWDAAKDGNSVYSGAGYLLDVSASVSDMNGLTALWLFLCDTSQLSATVSLISGGTYSGQPTLGVTAPNGDGTPITATAVMGVGAVTVTAAGQYSQAPAVTIAAPSQGAAATAHASMGVNGATVTAGGSGYTSAPAVTFSAPQLPGGVTATGTATIASGAVTGITITAAGSGYTGEPTITLTGGGGTGATAAVASLGVAAVIVDTPGSGYDSEPSVQFATTYEIAGIAATATDTLTIVSITSNTGYGYTADPVVTPSGGGQTTAATFGGNSDAMHGTAEGIVPPVMVTQVGQIGFSDERRPKSGFWTGLTWVLSSSGSRVRGNTGATARVDVAIGQ